MYMSLFSNVHINYIHSLFVYFHATLYTCTMNMYIFMYMYIGTQLENQVESGRRILKLYQEIVQLWIMDAESWLYLLTVLLHLTLKLLYETLPPPTNRDTTLGGNLADLLLQVHVHCIY